MKYILLTLAVMIMSLSFSTAHAMGERNNMVEGDRFTEREIDIIRDVFETIDIVTGGDGFDDDEGYNHKNKNKSKGLPPGLAKKDRLPPGLEKQLERNGTLPPGLAKRDLPDDLESRLPRRDDRYERVIVDNDVVLLERTTRRILDIIRDVNKK